MFANNSQTSQRPQQEQGTPLMITPVKGALSSPYSNPIYMKTFVNFSAGNTATNSCFSRNRGKNPVWDSPCKLTLKNSSPIITVKVYNEYQQEQFDFIGSGTLPIRGMEVKGNRWLDLKDEHNNPAGKILLFWDKQAYLQKGQPPKLIQSTPYRNQQKNFQRKNIVVGNSSNFQYGQKNGQIENSNLNKSVVHQTRGDWSGETIGKKNALRNDLYGYGGGFLDEDDNPYVRREGLYKFDYRNGETDREYGYRGDSGWLC